MNKHEKKYEILSFLVRALEENEKHNVLESADRTRLEELIEDIETDEKMYSEHAKKFGLES